MVSAWGRIDDLTSSLESPSFGISSVSFAATGRIDVTLSKPFGSTEYVVLYTAQWAAASSANSFCSTTVGVSSFRLHTLIVAANGSGDFTDSPDRSLIVVIGDQS